ncbi:hypothetical protein QJQ58_16395 [Paenibacillus dendritiformis]|uniref:hypothetical protein n=1 Tax=Paenibacillus TaxID=44249 RepID=UPI00248CDB34|nr:hypothetical protein [Paenibacillus dendritiformis]WGU92170.1 hypothetical protein QJQ58_16395 [Paenibacillus dendritiformis]
MKQAIDNVKMEQWMNAPHIQGVLQLIPDSRKLAVQEYHRCDHLYIVIDEQCPSSPYHTETEQDSSITQWIFIHPDQWRAWSTSMEGLPMMSSFGRIEIIADRSGMLAEWQQLHRAGGKELFQSEYMKMYAMFLDCYSQAKQFAGAGHMLDAYRFVDQAFYYWARIAVMEQKEIPSPALWQQVKLLNLGVYKMYEEFTTSTETLAQRIELALLACEFSLSTKSAECCHPLLEWIKEHGAPVAITEVLQHAEFRALTEYLPMLLKKLAYRGYLREKLVDHPSPYGELGRTPAYEWAG